MLFIKLILFLILFICSCVLLILTVLWPMVGFVFFLFECAFLSSKYHPVVITSTKEHAL